MSITVAFLLASASTAQGQPAPAVPAAATEAPAKPVKEKKICKVDPDADPASHMIKRTCKTATEWQQQGVLGSSRSGFSISGDKMQDGGH
jgi:hypothetical protein